MLISFLYLLIRKEKFSYGKGPEYFISNHRDQILREDGHEITMEVIEPIESLEGEIAVTFELNEFLAQRVRKSASKNFFPLFLAGNCNSSIGTLAGIGSEKTGIIWFDAHGDFNTPETTEEAPANHLSPPGGLIINELKEAIHLIKKNFVLAAAGITAYDPDCDKDNKTLNAGLSIIKLILQ